MADELDMALRSYQSIEAGESEYRSVHRLAAERVALMRAADTKAPMLAPQSVRDDALELARVGRLAGYPAFQKAPAKDDTPSDEGGDDRDARFRAAYGVVGELVLLTNALDHQLNHVRIQVLHLVESPMLEAVVATLDTVRKIEMLRERSKFIAQSRWQKPLVSYVDKLERVSKWRITAAAKLLKTLQLGKEPVAKRVPYGELKSAISLGESALADGLALIENLAGISFADVMYFTFAIVQAFSTLYACGECAGRFGVPHWVLSPAR